MLYVDLHLLKISNYLPSISDYSAIDYITFLKFQHHKRINLVECLSIMNR